MTGKIMAKGMLVAIVLTIGLEVGQAQVDLQGDPLPDGAIMRLGSRRWRPGGSFLFLTFAPDGKRLASWHEEHYTTAALTIWDVPTGRELRRIEMPDTGLVSWTWLPDGRAIAHTSDGIQFCDAIDKKAAYTTRKPEKAGSLGKKVEIPLLDGTRSVSYRTISSNGKYLAGWVERDGNKDKEIFLWDIASQPIESEVAKPRRLAACPNNCDDLAFTPDSRKLVAFCPQNDKKGNAKEHLVAVYDMATGKELRRFTSPAPLGNGARKSVALSPRYLAFGLEDEQGTLLLWDLEKRADKRVVTGHKKTPFSGYGVSALAFTADGTRLITAGRDSALKVWDVTADPKELRTISDAYPAWIEALAVAADGSRVACAGQNGIIRHWDLTTGAELGIQPGHGDRVTGVGVTPDGTAALTSSMDHFLRIWDLKTGRQRHAIPMPASKTSWPLALMAPEGSTVVVSVADKIRTWNIASGQEFSLPELPGDIKGGHITFAVDGKTLIACYSDKAMLLDWPSGKLRRRFTLPAPANKPGEANCNAAALSPDGRWFATLADRSWYRDERGLRFGYAADGVLDLWNATTGARVHRLADGPGVGRKALFTGDGDLLFDGSGDLHPLGGGLAVPLQGEFHLIDPLTGRLKQSFEPAPKMPGAKVRYNAAMSVAPDGRSVFCAGNDGVIHIYETATGKIRRSLTRHRDYVTGLAFTADGRHLLTGSIDLTALYWDISLAGFISKGTGPSTIEEQAKVWDKLLEINAKIGYQAMATLAAHPKVAMAIIRKGMKPAATSPDDATLDRLVAELGDANFGVRERATRELDKLGSAAGAGMRARLAKSPPLETHLRIVRFLNKHDPTTVTPLHLRELRALEVLEQLDSPDSRAALTELAKGAPNARLTRAAAGSLARCETRAVRSGK